MLQPINSNKSNRVFYNLLLKIGAIGRYQTIGLILWSTLFMISSSISSMNPYLFHQTPFICLDKAQKQCQSFVCSLPPHERSNYLEIINQQTFLQQFGDFRCERQDEINDYQTYIYLAGLCGIFITILLSSYVRKKVFVQSCIIIFLLSFVLLLVIKQLQAAILLLAVNEACQTVIIELAVCFITETVLEEERGRQSMMLLIFYNAGSTANGILFYLLPWHYVIIFYFFVPLLLVLIGLLWYVKDPPLDLIADFTAAQAHRQLIFIAQQNGRRELSIEQVEIIKEEYQINLKEKSQDEQFTVIDIFKYRSIRACVISCIIFHFCLDFNFYAPMIALGSLASNIYLDGIIFGLGSLLAAIGCYFFINELPRKKMIIYSTIVSIVLMVPFYFSIHFDATSELLSQIIQNSAIFLFRVANGITFQAFVFVQNEVFPGQVRSQAILLTCFFSVISKSIIPLVSNLNEQMDYSFCISFVLSSLAMLIVMTNIRETLGVPPPEVLEELAYHQEGEDIIDINYAASIHKKAKTSS